MVSVRGWLLIIFALVLSGRQVMAASTREERAYAHAASAFQGGFWSRAEVEFAEFAEKYPKSEHVAEAVLLEAEADLKQQKFLQAIDLLTTNGPQAGKLADQYVYWLGEAQFQNQDYAAAAETFARLIHAFHDSQWQLDAVVNEAVAYAKLGQWPRVSVLLNEPGGIFQTDVKKYPADERGQRGQLLLAEALLKQKELTEAETVLHSLAAQKLAPTLDWQRIRLLCRVQFASGDSNAALATTTNLIRLADLTGQPGMRAASVAEQGDVLERMGLTAEALATYRENIRTNVPPDWQRQAILKIASLAAAQTNFSEAEQSLEKFLTQFPNSPSADIARLSLGELYLTNYVAQPAATNSLQEAKSEFDQFLNSHTTNTLTGKALLDRGWCHWLEGTIAGDHGDFTNATQQTAESLADFEAATNALPPSVDLAVAWFKIGDALFRETNYADARDNYEAVWQNFTNFPAVDKDLAPQALYQTVRACMKLRDLAGTTNALARILTAYPRSDLADNSVLLAGEEFSDWQQPAAARALFEKFEELYPNSSLRPEAELALARTYEQQDNWPAAIGVYDRWVKQYTNDTALLPQVEYAQAMANYHAGNGKAAFAIMTNFVAQFPTNGWAPIAQYWIGDYFYRTGATNNSYYADAERNYELLYQNTNWQALPWVHTNLAYQARMMAGRAAMGRYGYPDAIQYFISLTGDTNCPPNVYLQALFAYGDALKLEPSQETNNPVVNFEQAIQVYKAICQKYPQTEQAALARGLIGNCYLQLAGQPQGAHFYDDASNAYAQVISSPLADAAGRSQAQIGIGDVLEKRAAQATGRNQTALWQQALQNYLDVLYGNNLRDHETPAPFWVEKAGLQAASVAETLGEWSQAVNVYRRLEYVFQQQDGLLPNLRSLLEQKIANAQTHIPPEQN